MIAGKQPGNLLMSEAVIVTGAAGFIASHIVDRLLAEGHTVTGIDNFLLGRRENLENAFRSGRFTLLEADLADAGVTHSLFATIHARQPVGTVWHMAANSDISAGIADANVDLRNTYLTTYNTLQAMKPLGIGRIAFASSSAIYGDLPVRLTETTGPLFPISNYGAMKLASEAIISAAVESHLQRAWIFRFPNVIGQRSTHGVIHDFIRKLRANPRELEVLGDGKQQKNYLHVRDLVEAMFSIVERGQDRLNWFNIGNRDEGATVRFIAESVIEAMQVPATIRYTGGAKGWVGDVPKFSYAVDKLLGIGWAPRYSSEEAVRVSIREQLAG